MKYKFISNKDFYNKIRIVLFKLNLLKEESL